MPRRKRPARSPVPGLQRRGSRAYYVRTLPRAVSVDRERGDRISKSLEAEWGSEAAVSRAGAVNTLWERGDWPVLRRWAAGEVHVTELVRAVREGDYDRLKRLNADGYLLGRAVEEHLRRTEATRSVRTHEIHRTACEALVAHFGADRPMHTVTTAEAEAFLHAPRGESGEPWAPATQASYRMVAGALWRYAIEREAEEAERQSVAPTLTRNPWRRARVRAARRSRPSVLTEEEIRDLLGHPAVAGTPREAFLAIAAYAGLRLQEITHLRTSQDVVLDGPRPMLRVQSRDGDHAWRPKTARSERDVRIPPVLVEILRRHIASGYAGTRYLFRAPGRDAPIRSHTAREWTRKAFEAAGLKYGRDEGDGVTLHSLRHSHATILLSRGISIAAVADRLGDTQQIVLETYSHALPDDEERALQILDRIAREDDR